MIRKEIGLDQFYTPQATADWVVTVLRDQPFWIDIVEAIEPTAGKGVFVNALKPYDHYMTVHAGDLEPLHPVHRAGRPAGAAGGARLQDAPKAPVGVRLRAAAPIHHLVGGR